MYHSNIYCAYLISNILARYTQGLNKVQYERTTDIRRLTFRRRITVDIVISNLKVNLNCCVLNEVYLT